MESKPRRSARAARSMSGAAAGSPNMIFSRVGNRYPRRTGMLYSRTVIALAGSGALVTVGPIRGILTAAHVLKELPDRGQVGLIQFSTNPLLQKQSIDVYLTDRLTIGGEHNGADGPDIGFLRLASHQAATLDATNVFFNLSKREESVLAD